MKRKLNKTTPSRKREIIDAALDCFHQNGYADTTMQEIRLKAKASYGSVYHHFKSKELLAVAVYMEGIREYQSTVIESLKNASGAEQGIKAVVSAHMKWTEDNPVWAKYLEDMRRADFIRDNEMLIEQMNNAFIPAVNRFLSAAVAAKEIRSMPKDVCISLIFGPCLEFTRLWIHQKTNTEIKKAGEVMGSALWQAIKS